MRTDMLCVLLLGCGSLGSLLAQENPQPRLPESPFAPDRFFDQFFGNETDAERRAAEKIKISVKEELQQGNAAAKAFLQQYRRRGVHVSNKSEDAKYVQTLLNQLRPFMKNARRYRRVQVWIIDTEDTDARSFPGGTVVVFSGLLQFCQSEAALVGILGHELSHIDRGHQLYHLRRFKLAQQSFSSGFNPKKMMNLGGMMAKMFIRPFRPEEESEADRDGARWAFQLGYDSAQMANLFLRLSQRDGVAGELMPTFLRSHPFHRDRYRAILRQTDAMKAERGDSTGELYVGIKNLELRVPKSRRRLDE